MLKNLNKSRIGLLLLVLIIGIAVAGCSSSSDDEVVAKVGGIKITKSELYDELVNQNGSQVLDALVADRIMELEVEKLNITISDEEIESNIDIMREYYVTEEALNEELEKNKLTLDDVRENIKTNLLIESLLEPYIDLTDEEMMEYFEANKASFGDEDQITASHILVETEEEASDIKAKLDEGGDFAELAKEYSTDTGNAENGGSLGTFAKSRMVKEFSDAAFALEVDEISDPVKSSHGYHIIWVEDKIEGEEILFEDHKEEVRNQLFQRKTQDAYMAWYADMLEEYEITSYLD